MVSSITNRITKRSDWEEEDLLFQKIKDSGPLRMYRLTVWPVAGGIPAVCDLATQPSLKGLHIYIGQLDLETS